MRGVILTVVLGVATQGAVCAARADSQAPGESFRITVSAPEKVQAGNVVQLSIHFTNTSDHDMNGTASYCGNVLLGYDYHVRRLDGATAGPLKAHWPGICVGTARGVGMLRPGQSGGGVADLEEIFDLTLGKYSVSVSCNVHDASGHKIGEIESNTITFTIVPAPFSIEITTPSADVKAGSPVPLDIRMTNTSNGDVAFEAPPEGGAVDTHFWYSCFKEGVGSVSKSGTEIPSARTLTLKPSQAHEQKADLASACDLSQPGIYRIQVLRPDPGDPKQGTVYSNEITLNVRP